MNKIVTFGEVLLRLTSPDKLKFSQTRSYIATYGGSELNVAVSLSGFGLDTEFITSLPANNGIADTAMEFLNAHRLKTDHVLREGKRMGCYFLEQGDVNRLPRIVYDRENSAFSQIKPGSVDWKAVLKEATWLHWSGITPSLSENTAEICREAIDAADELGLTISCDLNYRKKLWNYGKEAKDVMTELIPKSDIIFGSEDEYDAIFGIKYVGFNATSSNDEIDLSHYESLGKKVLSLVPRCKRVFVAIRNQINANHNTWAGVLYSNGSLKTSKIYDITNIVDNVGVGDAFCGGLIYGLNTYTDDQKVLDFATAAGCLKHTVFGDVNLVSRGEVENLMKGEGSGKLAR